MAGIVRRHDRGRQADGRRPGVDGRAHHRRLVLSRAMGSDRPCGPTASSRRSRRHRARGRAGVSARGSRRADRGRSGRCRAPGRRGRAPRFHDEGLAEIGGRSRSDGAHLVASSAGTGRRRWARAEPDAMRAARSLCQGARPRPAFERAARAASRSRPRVHRRRARVIRDRRGSADRAPRGRRAAGLGLPAPIAGLRDAPRLALLRAGAELFRRDRGQRAAGGRRPQACGALGLRGIVRHGRPGHRGGHTVHGAFHGYGRRLRHHAAVADRAVRLRGARPRAGPALPPPDARARVEPLLAQARPLDGASAAVPGVSALRLGCLARMGREPAGRAARRRRGPRRDRADRVRVVASSIAGRRPRALAADGDLGRRRAASGADRRHRRAGPARRRRAFARARSRRRARGRLGAL